MKIKTRINIQLKLWNNEKLVLDTSRRIKSRILALAQVSPWQKAYLKVTYDYRRGFFNAGEYYKYKDLKEALSAFTEKGLLDYILGE